MSKPFDYYCSYYKRRTYRKGDFCGECGERIYEKISHHEPNYSNKGG